MICSILPEACFAVNSIVVYQAAADAQQACCIKLSCISRISRVHKLGICQLVSVFETTDRTRALCLQHINLGHQHALLIRQHGQSRVGTNSSLTILHSYLRLRNISACSQSAHPGLMQFAISEPVFQTSVPTGHKMRHPSCFSNL